MDLLDRVAEPAAQLLGTVDDVLCIAGARADHPVWPRLRAVGAGTGPSLQAVLALRPVAVRAAAAELRTLASQCRTAVAGAGVAQLWHGAAADAFRRRWDAVEGYLGGPADPGEPSPAGRLAATAAHLDDVARWMADTRSALVAALGEVIGSAEAVRVRSLRGLPTAEVAEAAAAIGAHVLAPVAESIEAGQELADGWSGRLEVISFGSQLPVPGPHSSTVLEVPR